MRTIISDSVGMIRAQAPVSPGEFQMGRYQVAALLHDQKPCTGILTW